MLGPSIDSLSSPPPLSLFRQVTKDDEQLDRTGVNPAVNVLMIGTGEYTTGYVHDAPSDSDKTAGVVALTMFDLRARGKVQRIGLCGVNGRKFPQIRTHLGKAIGSTYSGLDVSLETYPEDDIVDSQAYLNALQSFQPGDAVTIFTPDDTHFEIALAAIEKGLHVLVTKPAVKTLEQHQSLLDAAIRQNVLVAVEVHKRWDPMYTDARDRIQHLGHFSYLYSYMSQPKHQLETFKQWAGKSSDISYYLNSHHVDFHEWALGGTSRPIKVTATASEGVAKKLHNIDCEDTITLLVEWENLSSPDAGKGTAIYTSSWVAPKSDVHSQQRFFYMGQKGEVTIDQAHRGYTVSEDGVGFKSVNPLFMKYTPSDGKFAGQLGYGYRSFEAFVDAVSAINRGIATPSDFDHRLATLATTQRTTAVLEAGRLSLDSQKSVIISYGDMIDQCMPTKLSIEQ